MSRTVAHEHNSWEIVRKRKNVSTLRCRECQHQVKKKGLAKCDQFYARGACSRTACKYLHVHHRKLNLEQRVSLHGTMVLNGVPTVLKQKFVDSSESSDDGSSESFIEHDSVMTTDEEEAEVELQTKACLPSETSRIIVILNDDGTTDIQYVES
eukprot:TRINITY_DN911_c1_g1_i12.p1 TRINITY_DN911_c1_g1~~TRINITY_DN911_c1_g1_i12.p1  ORF type:complete len:171 (+),score=55.19 TRINITY_DN911_c1_g1_i12:54-515(+)